MFERSFVVAAVVIFVLTGCASKTLTKKLPYLIGKDIDYAISILGAPSKVTRYGDTDFVSWTVSQQGTMILPDYNTITTRGYVDSMPLYGYSTYTGSKVVPVNADCTITLYVQEGTVTGGQWSGNEFGCEYFANVLKQLSE